MFIFLTLFYYMLLAFLTNVSLARICILLQNIQKQLMHPNDRSKIQQAISVLQEVLGQKSGSGGVQKILIPGLDEEAANFTNISNQLEPEIKDLTKVLTNSINLMQNILNYSAACKAPNEQQKKALQEKFTAEFNKAEAIERNPNFVSHARAVKQLLSVPFWVLTNSPQMMIKGGLEAADFNALKFQQKKNEAHNAWYKSVGKAFRIIQQFTKEYQMGLTFNHQGTASWADIISGSGHQSAKQEVPQQNTQQPVQVQAKQQVPKAPKKQLQGQVWLVSNWKNEKITLTGLEMKHGIFVENCHDCHIALDEKFKSLQMSKCTNIVLRVNSCVSGVEIMNCKNVQLTVKGQTPSISVDTTEKAKVILNEQFLNTDIVSSKASQLNVFYEKNDNQSKSYLVGEQLITKWNPNTHKFETKIYDKFL